MKNEVEITRQQIRAQFAALQQLVTERTGQILAVIARQEQARARVEEELRLLSGSVRRLELRAAAKK